MKAKRITAMAVFWVLLISGGLLLGAGEPQKHVFTEGSLNWDAVGAIAIIGISFMSGTWFIVSMAIQSAIQSAQAELRAEICDPDRGFVPIRMCTDRHQDTERRIEVLEEQARVARGRHFSDHREDNRRLDKLEDGA